VGPIGPRLLVSVIYNVNVCVENVQQLAPASMKVFWSFSSTLALIFLHFALHIVTCSQSLHITFQKYFEASHVKPCGDTGCTWGEGSGISELCLLPMAKKAKKHLELS
jgi:hypothetical protein